MIDYRLVFLSLREGQYDDPCFIWACNPTRSRWMSYHIYMLRGIGLLDFLRNKRWSTSPRGSPKARLNSRDALPAMILSVETGNWWESLIHPLQHVAQDLFDPKSAQPCFSWGREANPFKSFATSLRRRAVGLSSLALLASSVRPKKPGPSWGAGNLMQGFTCNWNILAMNCQIWLTLTLSDPLFLILMTPHLALDLKIGPPVRLLELLLPEKFCALTGPRLEPFKKLGIRMVGFLLCYIKHNDQALFRTC